MHFLDQIPQYVKKKLKGTEILLQDWNASRFILMNIDESEFGSRIKNLKINSERIEITKKTM